jgi:hypothetical protein
VVLAVTQEQSYDCLLWVGSGYYNHFPTILIYNQLMKKDFDKPLVKQLKKIYSTFHQTQLYNKEVTELIKSHSDTFTPLSKVPPWAHLYEMPYQTFLAVCVVALGLKYAVLSTEDSADKTQAFIDYVDNMPDTSDDDDLSDKDKSSRISIYMAINRQLLSLAMHGQSLSELVALVQDGDDNALFDAVLVDCSIVHAPSIANRIHTAQLNHDESFMVLLSKAIAKTKPRRPQEKHDDLRYMIEVIDEGIGLKNISNNKLFDILADHLELYDGSTDGLEKLIQRRADKSRT